MITLHSPRGTGAGEGPYIAIHDGFQGVSLSSETSIDRKLRKIQSSQRYGQGVSQP